MADPIRWPAQAVDEAACDLAEPATKLLQQLSVLETHDDITKGTSLFTTPQSLQVVTSGALQSTKVSGLFASVGGAGGAAAAAWGAYQAEDLAVRATLVGAVAVILAAGLLSLSMVVSADVQARSAATVAQYRARASIAGTFLTMAGLAQRSAQPEQPPQVQGRNGTAPQTPPPGDDADDCVVLSTCVPLGLQVRLATSD